MHAIIARALRLVTRIRHFWMIIFWIDHWLHGSDDDFALRLAVAIVQ